MDSANSMSNTQPAARQANYYGKLKKTLFPWQLECLDVWFKNRGRGIVNVVTGAGKTILAIGAIARLESILGNTSAAELKIKVIVPKIFLAQQWSQTLQSDLGIAREDIGFYSGLRKDPPTRKFMIYVVDSARNILKKHLQADELLGNSILLIADECHRYGSPANSKIFDYMRDQSTTFDLPYFYTLGLSATPLTASFHEILSPFLGPQIYQYGFSDALNDNIISNFAIFNLKLKFNPYEEDRYLELSGQLTYVLEKLMHLNPYLHGLDSPHFFASLENMARDFADPRLANLARSVLTLSVIRKDLVYRAESRIDCVQNLVAQIPPSSKILIFSERIETAELIYKKLQYTYPGQVVRYHSKMDDNSKKLALRKYSDSECRILSSCRALDEGLNIPETDVGIIASSTSSSRQRIQRLGRILRRSRNNRIASLYYLYIGSSNEERELLSGINQELSGRVPLLDLDYDQQTQTFIHPAYQIIADKVQNYCLYRGWNTTIISEIKRNLELAKLNCDWWTSEIICRANIESAATRAERNYWISILLLVQANLNRLP